MPRRFTLTPKRQRTQIAGGATTYPGLVRPQSALPVPVREPTPPVAPAGAATASQPNRQMWAGQQAQQGQFLAQQNEMFAQQQAMLQQFATTVQQQAEASMLGGTKGKGAKRARAGLFARLLERGVVDPKGRAHVGNRPLFSWDRTDTTMARGALASLIRASKELGRPIPGGGYRSASAQQGLVNANAGSGIPTASVGQSLHEQGLAIDIPTSFLKANPKVIKILERLGWNRWNASVEPWHFSYRKTG